MTRILIVFTAGLLAGFALTLLSIMIVIPGKLFVEKESPMGFNETVSALTDSAEASQWTISHSYNLQATMEKNGYIVDPVLVVSLCNPSHAHNILNNISSRRISAMMPCRLAVYEKEGKTYTSIFNSRIMYPFLNRNDRKTLKATTNETIQIINKIH
jgi:uncharacterized protein (DUF302 family)